MGVLAYLTCSRGLILPSTLRSISSLGVSGSIALITTSTTFSTVCLVTLFFRHRSQYKSEQKSSVESSTQKSIIDQIEAALLPGSSEFAKKRLVNSLEKSKNTQLKYKAILLLEDNNTTTNFFGEPDGVYVALKAEIEAKIANKDECIIILVCSSNERFQDFERTRQNSPDLFRAVTGAYQFVALPPRTKFFDRTEENIVKLITI